MCFLDVSEHSKTFEWKKNFVSVCPSGRPAVRPSVSKFSRDWWCRCRKCQQISTELVNAESPVDFGSDRIWKNRGSGWYSARFCLVLRGSSRDLLGSVKAWLWGSLTVQNQQITWFCSANRTRRTAKNQRRTSQNRAENHKEPEEPRRIPPRINRTKLNC